MNGMSGMSGMDGGILLIDAGNTRIKWGWLDPSGHVAAGEVQLHEHLDALTTHWQASRPATATPAAPLTVWLCSVAGTARDTALRAQLAQAFPAAMTVHQVATTAEMGGVRNGYRNPSQLGTDRWVSAIGAHALWPATPLLVVTAGTATTLDVVSADGEFRGGMILPGLTLMLQSLARRTAQLPDIGEADIVDPPAWADNTEDAIALGCLAAQTGAIVHAWQALTRETSDVQPLCILSGGARHAIAPALPVPFVMHDNLVLEGLAQLATAGGDQA